jgi:hypothetical protein
MNKEQNLVIIGKQSLNNYQNMKKVDTTQGIKDKITNIIKLFEIGELDGKQTAENLILKMTNRDKRIVKAGINLYNKLILKIKNNIQNKINNKIRNTAADKIT